MAKKISEPLRPIISGKRPKVLLVGNGINLSFSNGIESWAEIISSEIVNSGSDICYNQIKDLLAPMQIVVATGDCVDKRMKALADKLMKIEVPDLWWLICCKKRNFPGTKIYYYTLKSESTAKELLMRSYGVEIVSGKELNARSDSYLDFYEKAFGRIRES